jgi:hypothetical protein
LENLTRRPENGNEQGKMVAFMRLHPPTFGSAEDDPLSADDWLHYHKEIKCNTSHR